MDNPIKKNAPEKKVKAIDTKMCEDVKRQNKSSLPEIPCHLKSHYSIDIKILTFYDNTKFTNAWALVSQNRLSQVT